MNAESISQAMELWLVTLEAEGRSYHTGTTYRSHMRIFLKWLGESRELTDFTWRLFLADYRRDHSPFSCRSVAASVRSFVSFCVREGVMTGDLLSKMKLPRVPDTARKALSDGQVKTMLAYLASERHPFGLRNYAAVAVMLDTGIRMSELVSLTADDYMADYLRIQRGKSGRPRVVPLGKRAQRVLMRYLAVARPQLDPCCDHLFLGDGRGHTGRGSPWTRQGVGDFFKKLSKKLGFRVGAHMLRHTFTTQALRSGADLETIRRIGGWTDFKMLSVYAHLQVDDLREKHRKFSLFDRLG
jgi:site-specific recombinase XerD